MSLLATMALAGVAWTALPAGAYGGGANHDMWQVGLSFNCNNPSLCEQVGGAGGFWGWAGFGRSADGTRTCGDGEFAFCFRAVGGGGAGAGHTSIAIESWTIESGSAGPQTFFAGGEESDSFRGTKTTFEFSNEDTAITAVPEHYSTSEVFGFTAPGWPSRVRLRSGLPSSADAGFALLGLAQA